MTSTATDSNSILSLLTHTIPQASLTYAHELWKQSPFELKLTKSRQTKVGDFSCQHPSAHARITLNHDLNPYLFLLTYIHEVAHLRVYLSYGRNAEAHGQQWKTSFQQLLGPLLEESVFPTQILSELQRHMANPKASSFADGALTQALRSFDKNHHLAIVLSSVPEGSIFKLQGKYFKKGKKRRTRVLCQEVKSKRNFLVPVEAQVSDVQLALL
jgi:SprT protein